MVRHMLDNKLAVSLKLNTPNIRLSNFTPWYLFKKVKAYVYTYTNILAALLVIIGKWKQRKFLFRGEQINKFWYIHTMEY